jgi:UDP-glucose 6-dehydrogenase
MGKNNNSSWTSILFMLKSKGINIKDYDYNDKTNEKKMIDGDHPFVMYGRRFYQNP